MNNGQTRRGLIIAWLRRDRPNGSLHAQQVQVPFDPHSLAAGEPTRSSSKPILASIGFVAVAVVPALVLCWLTRAAADIYYTTVFAWLLSAIVAATFCLEASNQFYKLLNRPAANETPLPIRGARFLLATALYFVALVMGSQLSLRIENYWLYFAFGNYAPYALQHILLLVLLLTTWEWYEKLAKGAIHPKDRQFISGRSATGHDEAERRRRELFN